jgi:hypothetical protein
MEPSRMITRHDERRTNLGAGLSQDWVVLLSLCAV